MTEVPLWSSTRIRGLSKEVDLLLKNRYFEANPTSEVGIALLSRPALKKWLDVGGGPIRAIYTQMGVFDNSLFVVSGEDLYEVGTDESVTLIEANLLTNAETTPEMVSTAPIGATPAYLYITDGGELSVYDGSTVTQVAMPDSVGTVSLAFIAGYVIVIPAQETGINGRFYWIEPGDTTVDPLNFATAERSPDRAVSVRVFGDQFWILGDNSTEVWYPTGDPVAPFARSQGRLFDKGVWEGTAVQVGDSIMLVDADGVVQKISASPERVSDHSIEERIRNAKKLANI
jgi:hypothetical protein